MKIKIQYLILFAFSIISCKQQDTAQIEYEIINQSTPNQSTSILFDEQFKLSKIIKLETTSESLIDFTQKIIFSSEYIFIKGGKELFQFDLNGKFLNKISNQGNGPGEYRNLTDILVFEDLKRIWIYDSGIRKILQFNFNMEFESEQKLGGPFLDIEVFNNKIFGTSGYSYNDKNKSSIMVFNGNNILNISSDTSFLPIDIRKSKTIHVQRFDLFSVNKYKLNFVNSFNDTIYNLDRFGAISKEFYIDFGDKKVLEDDLINESFTTIKDVFDNLKNKNKSYNISNILNSEKTLIYSFYNSGKSYFSLYDKIEGNLSTGDILAFGNDNLFLDGEIKFGKADSNENIYFVIPSELINKYSFADSLGITDSDNSIILVFDEK